MNKMCKVMLQKSHQTYEYLQAMEKISKFNKFRDINKTVGPGKKYEINKRRSYVYSGLQNMVNHKGLINLHQSFQIDQSDNFYATFLRFFFISLSLKENPRHFQSTDTKLLEIVQILKAPKSSNASREDVDVSSEAPG